MKNLKYILLCALLTSSMYASSIDEVINNMVKTYGGEENLKNLTAYKQTWKINAIAQGLQGIDEREVILPNQLKTTLTYEDKIESRVITPTQRYKTFNGKKEEASGMNAQAMQLQLKRLYSPLVLKSLTSKLQLEDYQNYHALVLKQDNTKVVYFVDKKSFLIMQVTGIIYIQKEKIVFKTSYTQFKKFEEIVIPTKEYKSTNNIQTAVLTLDKMESMIIIK